MRRDDGEMRRVGGAEGRDAVQGSHGDLGTRRRGETDCCGTSVCGQGRLEFSRPETILNHSDAEVRRREGRKV